MLFPSPGDFTNPGMESAFLVSPALAGGFFTTEPPGKPIITMVSCYNKSIHRKKKNIYIYIHIYINWKGEVLLSVQHGVEALFPTSLVKNLYSY